MRLEILYQDACFIAVNKPAGLLVHRSPIANDATEFAVQMLRDQIGQPVFPAHRLDRKTSGVLLFALVPELNPVAQQLFSERKTQKKYLAVVRGHAPAELEIDYPLTNDRGIIQSATTHWRTLEQYEWEVPLGKHDTSRYSLVEMQPLTGRFHQLRKHAAHIFHPIIGDRPHGCNKQNRLWKSTWGMERMLLHAESLAFWHPVECRDVFIEAGTDAIFSKALAALRAGKAQQMA